MLEDIREPAYSVSGEILGFENIFAQIRLSDKQVILWPIKKLPDHIRPGDTVVLAIQAETGPQSDSDTMARRLLNIIINTEHSKPANAGNNTP